MAKEILRMQMLAGIITEGQYKQLLEDMEVVNRILDKISSQGKDSLTPAEKKYLDAYSKGERDLEDPAHHRDYIIKDEIDNDGDPVEPYIETHLFLEYLHNLLSQAGYKIPEDVEEAIEAQAYDTNIAYLDNDDPESLDYFENFNLQDAIDIVNEILEDGDDWEYDSIEDFK